MGPLATDPPPVPLPANPAGADGPPPEAGPPPTPPLGTATGTGVAGPGTRRGGPPGTVDSAAASAARGVMFSGRGTGTRPSAGTATVSRLPAAASSATAGRIPPRT